MFVRDISPFIGSVAIFFVNADEAKGCTGLMISFFWIGAINTILRDLCINMNNHQNAIFHQITNFLKTPLALLGVDLKNFQFNKTCHFANHPYLCKGLSQLYHFQITTLKNSDALIQK